MISKSELGGSFCTCLVTLLLLGVAGCLSAGNQVLRDETEQTVAGRLVEGQTTQAEVRSLYGSPTSVSFTDGGLEIWTYTLSDLHTDAVNFVPFMALFGSSRSGTSKELVILFDLQLVVRRYSMSESDFSIKTGVFK